MRSKKSEKRVKLWAKRYEQGLCVYCGTKEYKVGTKGCVDCLKKKYETNKKCGVSSPEKQKLYRKKVKDEVINKYGGQCQICGEKQLECLTINLINNDTTKKQKLYDYKSDNLHKLYLRLRKEDTRDNLRVICTNCKSFNTKEIIKLYKKGRLISEIEEKTGKSNSTIYRVLRRNGCKLRGGKIKRPPRPPKHNLVGKKYFHLTVIKMAITKKADGKTWRAICKCDCGRIADVCVNYLMRNLRKTCGHKKCKFFRQEYTNSGKQNVTFTGFEGIHGQRWAAIHCGAERRNLEFSIKIEDMWDMYIQQNKKCALTGLPIKFGRRNYDETTASLDRIDSKKGYIKGNVQWVYKDVNFMKWDLDQNHFINLCHIIADLNPKK